MSEPCAKCGTTPVLRVNDGHSYRWCPTCARLPFVPSEVDLLATLRAGKPLQVYCNRCYQPLPSITAGTCMNCGKLAPVEPKGTR